MKNPTIHFPELEKFLREESKTEYEKVKNDAESSAVRNMPNPIGDRMDFYFENHHEHYQSLITRINQDVQISSYCYAVLRGNEQQAAEILNLHNDIRKLQDRLIDVNRRLNNRYTGGFNILKILPAASFALSLTDGIYNRGFFESTGLSYLDSWFAAGGTGIALWAIAHFVFPKIVDGPKTMLKKWLAVSGFGAAAGTVFYFLGSARANFREAQLAAEGIALDISPWPIALLSLVIFAAACGISYYLHQKRSGNFLQRTEAEELKAEQKNLRNQIEEKKRAIKKLEEERIAEQALATARIEYGYGLEQMVITSAKEAYHTFKRENLMHRPDRMKPSCFDQPYPFSFTTYCDLDFSKRSTVGTVTVLCIVLLAGMMSACNPKTTGTVDMDMAILSDITDPMLVCPDSAQVMGLVDLDADLWKGVHVTTGIISDKDINPVQTYSLAAEARLIGNTDVRKNKAARFTQELVHGLSQLCPTDSLDPLGHSIVYRAMVHQLHELQKSGAKQKYCIVYSNLYENSDLANFYDEKTLRLLKDKPQEMEQRFGEAAPLGDCSGITVWFVYQPLDYADNLHFVTVSTFFKNMLEKYGAEVKISASL